VLEGVATGPVVLAEESPLPFTLQRLFAFDAPWGVYPVFGYKSRTGLMLGAAYHSRGIFRANVPLAVKATYSTNTYRYVAARVGDRKMFDSPYGLALDIGWRADTRERFYGIGPSSSLDNRSNYGFRGMFGGVTLYRAFARGGEISLSGGMRRIDPEDGRLQTILHDRDSIASRMPNDDLYGLFGTLDLADIVATISYDWRKRPSSPLGGGTVGLNVGYTFGEGLGDSSVGYWRMHGEATHYVELFSGRVLGFSLIAEHVEPDDGTRIPFYDLPKLGGSRLLRGYKTGRFRDLGFVSFAAEYRWPLLRKLDALLLTDHGRVFRNLTKEFEFSNFRASYGGGLRFWNKAGHLSLMAAKGTEEWSFYINFGDSF
jgi:outer membrane protein assembly factor BamA